MASCLFGTGRPSRPHRQPRLAGRAHGRGSVTPFPGAGGRGRPTRSRADRRGRPPAGLDQSGAEGQAGQVGAAAAAGLVPDPVQVGADGADADVQLGGDLRVGAALGDQGDQLPFPGAEPCPGPAAAGCGGPGSVSIRAYSAAVARLIAAPRSSAARVRPGPSACRAARSGSSRRRASAAGPAPPSRRGARRARPTS